MEKEIFTTKIAIVLEEGLQSWQELNITAFLGSAVASHFPQTMGPAFEDGSNVKYLGIFRQPVMIFSATTSQLKDVYKASRSRNLEIGIYTRPIFSTQGDENLAAIKSVKEEDQDLVGMLIYGAKGLVDRSLSGLKLHK